MHMVSDGQLIRIEQTQTRLEELTKRIMIGVGGVGELIVGSDCKWVENTTLAAGTTPNNPPRQPTSTGPTPSAAHSAPTGHNQASKGLMDIVVIGHSASACACSQSAQQPSADGHAQSVNTHSGRSTLDHRTPSLL